MKVFVWFCLLTFPALASCTTKSGDAKALKTFTSPDGAFRFRYAQLLFRCQVGNERTSGAEPENTCAGQQSVCDDDDDSNTILACFGYPGMRAAFAVAEIPAANTESVCLRGPEDWPMEVRGIRTIHGVKFKAFEVSTAWTSGGLSGDLYRTFRLNKCYELGIRSIRSARNEDETGNKVERTKRQAIELGKRLDEPLKSFRFLE